MAAKLKLVYWGARGIMETARMMCAISGTDFEDQRHGAPCTDAAVVDANLGRMPALVTPAGVAIGQSGAINFYIAQTQGFLGSSAEEAATILSWADSLKEMLDVWSKLVPYGTEPTAEAFAAFFDNAEASDVTGAADGSKRAARAARWYLGRLERLTSSTPGFAVGNKISLADVMLFRHFGDVVNNKELGYKAEPFGSSAKTEALLASFPRIKAIVENVRANAKLQSYLAARPQVA
jgi:glutathione S-transferase